MKGIQSLLRKQLLPHAEELGISIFSHAGKSCTCIPEISKHSVFRLLVIKELLAVQHPAPASAIFWLPAGWQEPQVWTLPYFSVL